MSNNEGETTEGSPASLPIHQVDGDESPTNSERPMAWYRFEGVAIAQGYNLSGMGRGALVMSNIFLSTSFVYLAQEEAGCLDDNNEVIEDCDGKAYGFQPASFISNIAVISSVLSALFMPLIGAMVDYTRHRKTLGIVVSTMMIMIQIIQIGTVSETWLGMAIIQAFSGFLYQALVLAVYAYLPDMSYQLGEEKMTKFTSNFQMTQFCSQAGFLLVVTGLSLALSLGDVVAAQMSQAINVVWSGLCFYYSWRLFEPVPPRHVLPKGHSLLTQGFSQIYRTALEVNRRYKRGTRWFFLALIFAEASANAFTVVAVVYLDEQLGLSFTEIGIFFFVSLVSSIPGSFLGAFVTSRLDPKRSWELVMSLMFVWAAGGAIIADYLPKNLWYLAYGWGCGIGMLLGWFYPTENLFFCMCLPKGQEAELAGFFVYCTQILGWLPPLIFSFMVEANVSQTYGVIAVCTFFVVAVVLLSMAAPWNEILEESGRAKEVDAGEHAAVKDVALIDAARDDSGVQDCVETAVETVKKDSVVSSEEEIH